MFKQRLQGFIAGVLVFVLIVGTLAIASPNVREVFFGVNVVVNGELQEFDYDMRPFISEGRTFLPVRGIAEALGVPVEWDGDAQTVYIGERPARAAVQTVQDGYLIMATNAYFPPFQFRSNAQDSVDGVDGICIAIAKIIADELGKTLRVVDMEFGAIILSVMNNEVDIGMAGMTITEERRTVVDFSIPYYTASQVIIANVDSGIQSAADLAGLRVGVVMNYTGDFIVSDMEDDGLVGSVVRVWALNDIILELNNGSVDAIVIDISTARALVEQQLNLKIIEDNNTFSAENYGIAVRQGNVQLLNEINRIIQRLIADGTIDRIVVSYTL